MKIGILTYHDGINHGAFLQTYSMYCELKKLNADVQVINYKSFKHWMIEYKCFLYTKKINLLVNNIRKIIKFKKSQQLLNCGKFTFCVDKIDSFDKVVLGSDEIWNYSNELGLNPVYFGYGIKAKSIITYAVSFGSLSSETKLPDQLINCICNIDALSVRDENSMKILKNNLPKTKFVEKVLDPTFLHDFSGEEKSCKYKNFILLYTTGVSIEQSKEIYDFAKKSNKILIAIGYYNKYCDYNIINLDPFEWLGFFLSADMVITTMFHGTVFSIKYNKEFCLIMDPYRKNKLSDLIKELNLGERVYSEENRLVNIFNSKIDYEFVNNILANKVELSRKFLEKNIYE